MSAPPSTPPLLSDKDGPHRAVKLADELETAFGYVVIGWRRGVEPGLRKGDYLDCLWGFKVDPHLYEIVDRGNCLDWNKQTFYLARRFEQPSPQWTIGGFLRMKRVRS